MTIQQLEYVVALDNYRHFVTAAEHCFVTQPTITTQVKKLEEEIGLQLFDRSKTPLKPTEAGEIFIRKARQIISEINQLKELVNHEIDHFEGEYKIGIIPTLSPYIVPFFAGNFAKKYPNTILKIEEMKSEDIIDALEKNKLHVGILVTPLHEQALREIPMYNEPFVFYGEENHPLLKKELLDSREVDTLEGLWLLDNGHCFREQVLNICNSPAYNRSIQFQSGSIETLKQMVDNFGGFTLIPEMAVKKSDIHRIVRFKEPVPIREVSLVTHKSFAKEGLLDALRKEILEQIPNQFTKNERYIRVKWK